MILDKDHMSYELKGPSGIRFFYASEEHLKQAVTEGFSAYNRLASYVIDVDGQFIKSRTFDPKVINAILSYGRSDILKLLDFMEDK